MSGFYYVLQRLGTVSLIKQIILEGKATGKRRRRRAWGGEEMRGMGGKGEKVFAAQSSLPFPPKKKELTNKTYNTIMRKTMKGH